MLEQHEPQREALVALLALVRPLPSVRGQVPFDIVASREGLVTLRALKLALGLVRLPVLRTRQQ